MTLPTNWVTGQTFAASDVNAMNTASNASVAARPQAGLFASRPAPGSTGSIYLSTDSQTLFRDDGTAWHAWGPLNRFTTPSAGASTTTLGTASFASDKGSRLLTLPSAAGFNWRIEYNTLSPSSGYTATAFIETSCVPAQSLQSSMVLLNSSSGSFVSFGPEFISSGWALFASKWNSATSFNNNYVGVAIANLLTMPNWLRVVDDGTTRYFQYSFNGVDWILLTSVARTDFVTPDSIGWGGSNSNGSTALLRLRSLEITNP